MADLDLAEIRRGLAALDASVAHTASGDARPRPEEVFAPEQHAGALDPNVMIVLGARGAGKSFWAGVLGNDDTRRAAALAYPNLGLDQLQVRFGFTGLSNDGSVSRETIDRYVGAKSKQSATQLWRCVLIRALLTAVDPSVDPPRIKDLMVQYEDPEVWEEACSRADKRLTKKGQRVLVIFDALDALALTWERLRTLLDALLEVAWSTRGFPSLRVKLFLRPDQLRDVGLRFVELPKLQAGASNLTWSGVDLYGLLFVRLASLRGHARAAYDALLSDEGIGPAPRALVKLRGWPPTKDPECQQRLFTRIAGAYMGRGPKKGRTYDWPVTHLADGHHEVTPRSFLTLMISAARYLPHPMDQVLSAEGIRHGLREASKVRVDQLALEFPWIKRVLAPLARLQVPCELKQIQERWKQTGTIEAIERQVKQGEFLSPFERGRGGDSQKLMQTLIRIGVLFERADDRLDMPDLFRVAARLLKKGGVAPEPVARRTA